MVTPDFKVTNQKDRNSDKQQLVFEGDLGSFNTEKILKKVKRLSLKGPQIEIVLQNVVSMDLTTIQLILSLKKSLESKSVETSIDARIPDDKLRLLKKTGFEFFVNK